MFQLLCLFILHILTQWMYGGKDLGYWNLLILLQPSGAILWKTHNVATSSMHYHNILNYYHYHAPLTPPSPPQAASCFCTPAPSTWRPGLPIGSCCRRLEPLITRYSSLAVAGNLKRGEISGFQMGVALGY